MKNLLKFAPVMGLAMSLLSCTSESLENDISSEPTSNELNEPCIDQNPITRVVNNGTIAFDFKVVDSDGIVIIDIPNIPANTTTSWASFNEGEVLFSLDSNQTSVRDDKVVLLMDNCMAYEIEINSNNQIVSYTPTSL
jgi:hypothetical protein